MIVVFKKGYFFLLLLTIFPFTFCVFGQSTSDSYQKLWEVIAADSTTEQKKLYFLEVYYRKAQIENNIFEEYRALEKKSFLVPFDKAVVLLDKMRPLVEKIPNDSLKGYFLNRNVGLYYSNRNFEKALDYAIQSEKYNEKKGNLYNLNSVRIDIGNIYYHIRDYDKAIIYFTQAKKYYQFQKDYNHQRAYVATLYSLGKTYLRLGDANLMSATIAESRQVVSQLKPTHQLLEKAYLDYLQGGLFYLQNNNEQAKQYFAQALPVVQQNGDFTNEHVIYLYLGKIAWRQNQKSEAVKYFKKIDALFRQKDFLNYELREAYEYLMAYYKETGNLEQQLHATESLIALNKQFEREQQSITKTLHQELDTKKLEAQRERLKSVLQTNQKTTNLWLGLLGVGLVGILWYAYRQYRAKKRLKIKFDELVNKIKTSEQNITKQVAIITPEIDSESVKKAKNRAPIAVKATEVRLLNKLEKFENEKDYLKPVKLEGLAQQWDTNRSTLSSLINTHKGSFNAYINKLRIEQLMIDLKNQKDLRKLSLTELANQYGFANAKSLATHFKAQTDLPPMYFIQQLEIENL